MPQKAPKYWLWGLAIVVAGFLMWYFSDIVGYILVSAVLAIVGRPLVDLLRKAKIGRHGMPQWAAAAVTLAAIWAVTLIFFSLFIPLVFSKISEFSSIDLQHLVDSFREPITMLQNFLEHTFSIQRSDFSLADSLTRNLNDFLNIGALNNLVTSAVTTVGHLAVALFSISFITFFFLKEENLFVNMVVAVFPSRYESNIKHAIASVTNLLKRYFTGLLIESTIITILVSGAMMLWGMQASNAFFIGFLMGLLNVIPYIGPLIGAALSIFIGILNPIAGFSALGMALVIGGSILAVKACDDFILQPVLYSNSVKAHPLEIFLVILIAGSTAGVLGMLLAIPTYNVIRVFAKEFFNKFRLVQKLTDKI
jgi:predicted PurR-regulated permease PerM